MLSEDLQETLLLCFTGDQTREDLIAALQLDGPSQLRRQYLRPAMDQGWIEQTIPDKPASRLQRFRLTEAGRERLRALRERKKRMPQLTEIVSGGQTGVDRAALDAAISRRFPYSGWLPRGRMTEAGPLPSWYQLRESEYSNYAVRTRWNVRDSDGTLVLYQSSLTGGTAITIDYCKQLGRPYYLATPPKHKTDYRKIQTDILLWAQSYSVHRLNVAGPRESGCPGIYDLSKPFIESLLDLDRAPTFSLTAPIQTEAVLTPIPTKATATTG